MRDSVRRVRELEKGYWKDVCAILRRQHHPREMRVALRVEVYEAREHRDGAIEGRQDWLPRRHLVS